MKLFQKAYPLTSIMLLCGGILFAGDSKQIKVMQLIANVHATTFMLKDNIFTDKIRENEVIKWNAMLNKVRDYVDVNAGGNKKLLDAEGYCWGFSEQLFSTISMIDKSVFSEKFLSEVIIVDIRNHLQKLQETIDLIFKGTSKQLENTTFYIYAQRKNNVKEVLLYLMKVLESALRKTWGDFDNRLGKLARKRRLAKERFV